MKRGCCGRWVKFIGTLSQTQAEEDLCVGGGDRPHPTDTPDSEQQAQIFILKKRQKSGGGESVGWVQPRYTNLCWPPDHPDEATCELYVYSLS